MTTPKKTRILWSMAKTRILPLLITGGLILSIVPLRPALALSQDQLNTYNSGIYYYDIAAGGTCSESSSNLVGNDNIRKAFNFFNSDGLPSVSAAGIIGNLEQESGQGIDPTAEQTPGAWEDMSSDSGHGIGIAQWDSGRRPAMIQYAESKGLTLQDLKTASDRNLSTQLNYLWQELISNYPGTYSQMKSETDVIQATTDFMNGYEGPGSPQLQNRTNYAKAALSQYGGSAISSSNSSGCLGGASGSSIVQIALAEVGTHETNGDNDSATCKYQGPGCGPTTGEEWCADFVSWVYKQAGVPFTGGLDGGWRIPGAAAVADWFKANGTWIDNPRSPVSVNDPSAPQPGDAVYYPDNGGHVNIVVSYDGKTVTIVGGNQSDSVNSEPYNVFGTAAGWGRLK